MSWDLLQGDCVEQMRQMDEASVDAIVTDPPYLIGFMGKEFDLQHKTFVERKSNRRAGSFEAEHGNHNPTDSRDQVRTRLAEGRRAQAWHEAWATEALRVLKPGGHLLAFGGTRTYHRLACAVEDAGFEIRDSISWQHMEHIFCRCDSLPYNHASDGDMRGVREEGQASAKPRGEGEDALLQPSVQRDGEGSGLGEARSQGSRGVDGGELDELPPEDERPEQSGVEGRSHDLSEEGQLRGCEVRPSARVGEVDGSEGRVHHGAPSTDGAEDRPTADAGGSGPPPRSQPAEQRLGEPGTVAYEWLPSGGGAWPGCPRCGKPLEPPHYGGPLAHCYGSGFPKSLDVSKAIDKAAGAEREVVVGKYELPDVADGRRMKGWECTNTTEPGVFGVSGQQNLTAPATPEAAQWEGWGTALKPAHEPIVVARKPLVGTVAQNVLEHGTGALNIDGCRIDTGDEEISTPQSDPANREGVVGSVMQATGGAERNHAAQAASVERTNTLGRWPANVALSHTEDCVPVGTRKVKGANAGLKEGTHDSGGGMLGGGLHEAGRADYVGRDGTETITAWDCSPECPVRMLDEQSGEVKGAMSNGKRAGTGYQENFGEQAQMPSYGDSGGASRFFYVAKASRAERNAGLTASEGDRPVFGDDGGTYQGLSNSKRPQSNAHPTVKPIDLMRWLVRLVCPVGGTVLDPFAGSGTTGIATVLEGFDFIGIEREEEYVEIAKARIEWWEQHQGREADEVLAETRRSENLREEYEAAGQMGLDL